jgi:hypothetical protein
MKASDIGPHPDGPAGHYIVFKGPVSMGEDCGSLAIRLNRLDTLPADPPSVRRTIHPGDNGPYLGFCAEWTPSARDIDLIVAGHPIRVNIIGDGLPPSMVWVKEDGEL